MNKQLLALLACPKCGGRLDYQRKHKRLLCQADQLAFEIRKGIPVLLRMDAIAIEK